MRSLAAAALPSPRDLLLLLRGTFFAAPEDEEHPLELPLLLELLELLEPLLLKELLPPPPPTPPLPLTRSPAGNFHVIIINIHITFGS